MTDEEVNKIIAEYMKDCIIGTHECEECGTVLLSDRNEKDGSMWGLHKYTESLDALVPVWEKLNKIPKEFRAGLHWDNDINTYPEKMTYASAHATAKAILELKHTK